MNASHAPTVDVGVLLAGGSSRRAGVDKRFLVLEGRTLLVRNLAFLRDLFPVVATVIGRGQSLDLGDGGAASRCFATPGRGVAARRHRHRARAFPPTGLRARGRHRLSPRRDAADAVIAAFRGHDASLRRASDTNTISPCSPCTGPRAWSLWPPSSSRVAIDRRHLRQRLPRRRCVSRRLAVPQHQHHERLPGSAHAARASVSGAAPAGGGQPALVAIVGRNHAAIAALTGDAPARAREARAARRYYRAACARPRDRSPRG